MITLVSIFAAMLLRIDFQTYHWIILGILAYFAIVSLTLKIFQRSKKYVVRFKVVENNLKFRQLSGFAPNDAVNGKIDR